MISEHKPVVAKLLEWLGEQGYPLEMHVAKMFRDAHYQITQSHIYVDPETQKPREIDLVAYKHSDRSNYGIDLDHPVGEESKGAGIFAGCCIECKYSQKKPWVLFMSDSPFGFAFDLYPITTAIGRKFLYHVTYQPDLPKVRELDNLYTSTAYGVTQAFTTGADVPYQAVMGVVKSTIARVEEHSVIDPFWGAAIPIYFPIIVIDAQLFECTLDEEGKPKLQEVDRGAVWSNAPVGNNSSTIVQIYTKPALSKLISWLDKVREALAGCDEQLIAIYSDILAAYNRQTNETARTR